MAVVGYIDGYVDENNREYGLTDTVAQGSINAMKDGTNIDSFGDVEAALADKVDKFGVDGLTIDWLEGVGVPDKLYVMEHNEIPQEGDDISGLPNDEAVRKAVKSAYDLTKDTVGWSGKNLLKEDAITHTQSGVTFTVNNDGSVTVNGTNSLSTSNVFFVHSRTVDDLDMPVGDYIASIGDIDLSDIGMSIRVIATRGSSVPTLAEIKNGEKTFTKIAGDIIGYVIVVNGNATIDNVTIYPMIRKADILDATYEPYRGTTAFPRDEQRVLGAKNLLQNKAVSRTENTLSITQNNDGTLTLDTSAATSSNVAFWINTNVPLESGRTYIVSGGANLTNDIVIDVRAYNGDTEVGSIADIRDSGGTMFTPTYSGYDTIKVRGWVRSGTSISNKTIYPMLRLATDPDDTYVPYAMTNRKLTEKIVEISKGTYSATFGNSSTFSFDITTPTGSIHSMFYAIVTGSESAEATFFVGYKVSDSVGNITKIGNGVATAVFDTTTGKFTITTGTNKYRTIFIITNAEIS